MANNEKQRMPSVWFVYGLAALALLTILGRVFWDQLHHRFDDVAMYLFALAGAGVLLPYVLLQLPRVKKMKLGDLEVELRDLEQDLEPVLTENRVNAPDEVIFPESWEWTSESATLDVDGTQLPAWVGDRQKLKTDSHEIFLAHVLRPSQRPGQKYDVFIFLKAGKDGNLRDVRKAEFFFGRYWQNRIFAVQNSGIRVGVATSAYGEFLAICRIEFVNGLHAVVSRFVDFEMGRILFPEESPSPA